MKKVLYHEGKEEGEYRVLEMEKNDKGEIYVRMKHGKKGDKENIEGEAMRIAYNDLSGFANRIERMLMQDEKGKATIYHEKEGDAYKVFEVEINDAGEIYARMAGGVKGDKENRNVVGIRMSENELAGLWIAMRKMLMS